MAPHSSALTIAGSDSGGGAGIQADLKTFSALGVYGTSAITAITPKNSRGVFAAKAISPEMLPAQIAALLADIPQQAIKIGMLASPEIEAATKATAARSCSAAAPASAPGPRRSNCPATGTVTSASLRLAIHPPEPT